jgi:hypothetical protein
VLPWILIAAFLTFVGLSHIRFFENRFLNDNGLPLTYLFISLGVNVLFAIPARRRLLTQFRQVATQRFEARPRQ